MTAVNPFKAPGRWFRGNTHSHSTESDGRLSIPDRFAAYRDAGYDFLVLTDHRKVSDVSAESRPNFLAISGSEVHPENPYGGDRYHFVAINIHEPIRDTELHPNEAIEAVRAQEGEVRDSGVLLGDVHEDIRLVRVRRVENEVQLHSRRVIEDGDGLRTDRTGGLREAEQGVEAHRALEVVHANADVGEARDGNGSRLRLAFCHCLS